MADQGLAAPGREREDRPYGRVRGRARTHGGYTDIPFLPQKKRIAIEDLLTWAYGEQMVHVARREAELVGGRGLNGPAGYGSGFALEAVDASPCVTFGAEDDAFAVHAAVAALSVVKAVLPADCIGRVDERIVVGSAVPCVQRVIAIDRKQLVMTAAIDGKRPDWLREPVLEVERGQLIYERDRRGRVRYEIDDRGRSVPKIVLQLVRFVGDMPWEVARARLVYAAWVEALAILRAALDGALERHQVTELMPRAAPWLDV